MTPNFITGFHRIGDFFEIFPKKKRFYRQILAREWYVSMFETANGGTFSVIFSPGGDKKEEFVLKNTGERNSSSSSTRPGRNERPAETDAAAVPSPLLSSRRRPPGLARVCSGFASGPTTTNCVTP